MKNLIILVVVLLVTSSPLLSQINSKTIKHYYIEDNHKKEVMLSTINEIILLDSDSDPEAFIILPSSMTSILITELVKNLPKLFYNQNKYIKEYGASYSLFGNTSKKPIKSFTYEKTGIDSNKNKVIISQLKFKVKDLSYLNKYRLITLSNFIINYTPVKLSKKNKFVNLVAEITLHYYDANHIKKELKLSPITIKNIIPNNFSNPNPNPKNNYSQLIPPIENIENIELKLTEVNSRKKDWDKWLEIFDNNKDKITNLLKELIMKE
ncbi:MAG: hypothetical protein JKY22_02175 [Flavobacteriaceae bacterium]|nr:hypothetical protein [Flavobacteriaceae bacterium]